MQGVAAARAFLLAVGLLATAVAAGQGAERREIGNHPGELEALVREPHRHWTVRGVEIEGRGAGEIELREVEVFEPTARVIINDGEAEQALARTSTRYLRGRIRGVPTSVVALTITSEGAITGLLTDGAKRWQLSRRTTDSPLEATTAAPPPGEVQPFQCGNERLTALPELQLERQLAPLASTLAELTEGQLYQATVAIETDHEFYQRFGNSTAALNYIGSLFNYISGIYELETQTRLVVGDVFLWSTASDPWVETGDTTCRLYEFGRYWRDNRSAVSRTIAHFLSGASSLSGVAWIDVLCRQPLTSNTATGCASVGSDLVSGGFGFSSGLSGVYQDAAGILWDADVVAHEIGHNFSSPHTHCYAGLGGNAEPVDGCYNQEAGAGCWTGSVALPGPGSLTGGTTGGRNGTIMSYCQMRPGNISNIAATLGLNHVYGIAPERVPTRMANRVAQVATSNPSCIPIVGGELLLTVEKSGTGSGRVGSTPAGIDCGGDCSENYPSGSTVTLSATADAGSTFAGFSGSGCSGSGDCLVTMNAARTVTATFNLVPDTTPDAFGFTAQTGVSIGATVTSNTISPTGYNSAAAISVANGQYSIGCTGSFTGSAGTISPGQGVCVRHTAAGTPSTTVTTTLTIGGVSGTFSSTTAQVQAQLFRAYLASDGNDGDPCTLAAPCRLLPAALNAVADGGEIWMLDSANYNTGTVNVDKSVSILAIPGAVGSVVATGGPAISIAASGLTVALRNLVIAPVVTLPAGTVGVSMTGASSLTIENSLIADLPEDGVAVDGAGTLRVANSTLRNNGYFAIRLVRGATAAVAGTHLLANGDGGIGAFGFYGSTTTTVSVSGCAISGGVTGVAASTNIAGAVARVSVTGTSIRETDYALRSTTTGLGSAELNVGSSLIADNDWAWQQSGAGSVLRSLGNNQMSGNGGSLGVLTPLAPQ